MALPTPQYPLGDACSMLFNNTLFTYNSQAFQSLQMQQGAQWSELPMGEVVIGGVCVKTTPKNDTTAAAFYIVGGTSNSSDYHGLQRYTFANGTWETLKPTVAVTQNRLYHSAVYLNTSDTILVYGGTQDGSKQSSSQTFTIQASWPYLVTAFQAIAPPAINPLLIPWTESKAIYLGGSEVNTKAMIFSPSKSWVDSNITLAAPFYNTTNIKGIVINGDDASKTLFTFDMTTSPNSVNRTILIDGDGNPVQNAGPVVSRRGLDIDELEERSARMVKRDNLTVADWPAYNGSLAPSSTRTTYSIARDQSGLVVVSGGNEEDVLCMFKARQNSWVNATAKLVSAAKGSTEGGLGTIPTTTTAPTTTASNATSSATASSTPAGPAFPVKVLGAVLGSIVGVALILLGILLLFRWRKKRRQYADAGHQRRASGIPNEKDGLEFADRGLPQMSSARQFRNHEPQSSQGSFSSVAILLGRVGGHKRGGDKGNGSQGSDSSSQFNKQYKSAISKPIPQEHSPQVAFASPSKDQRESRLADENGGATKQRRGSSRGGRRGSTRRSSGWNRYWSGGSAMNILGFGSKRTTYEDSDLSSESHYSDYRLPSLATQSSAMVAPLKVGDRPELNRVASGSPTIANGMSKFASSREMSGTIVRQGSMSSLSSYNDDRHDAFSSGIPASVHEQQSGWASVDRQDWATGRAQSSNYTDSVREKSKMSQNFPKGTHFQPPPPRSPPKPSSDMSWLNLGGESRI